MSEPILLALAEIWGDVFAWEIEHSRPKFVEVMGKTTQSLLEHLHNVKGLRMPRMAFIDHYSYIALRARGKLGPMHPERVQAYDLQMGNIAAEFAVIARM